MSARVRALVFAAALLGWPIPARAIATYDMTWNGCPGAAGATSRDSMSCSDPEAVKSLFVEFRLAQETVGVFGIEFEANLYQFGSFNVSISPSVPVTPFWFFGSDGCNPDPRIGISASARTCPATASPWIGGIADLRYSTHVGDLVSVEQGKLTGSIYTITPHTLEANRRYLAFRLDLPSASAGTLEGCRRGVEVVMKKLVIVTDTGSFEISQPGTEAACLALNDAPTYHCATCCCGPGCSPPPEAPNHRVCSTTAVESPTWGAIKSLYR